MTSREDLQLRKTYKKGKYNKRQRGQSAVALVCFENFSYEEYNKSRIPKFTFDESIGYLFIHNFLSRRNQLVTEFKEDLKNSEKSKNSKKYLDMRESIGLSSCYLANCLHRNYNGYMNHLRYDINNEDTFLFNYENYEVDVNPYKYSCKEKYPKLKFVEVRNNTVLKKLYGRTYKYKKLRNGYVDNISKELREIEFLFDDYNYLRIDLLAVKQYLDKELDLYIERTKRQNYKPKAGEFDYNSYLRDFMSACEIANGFYHFKRTVDNSDGRLHSEFQRASKRIRQFISINNDPMFEVDITAAVPTIFNHQLNKIKEELENRILSNSTLVSRMDEPNDPTCKSTIYSAQSMLSILTPLHCNQYVTNENLVHKVLSKLPLIATADWLNSFSHELGIYQSELSEGTLYENFKDSYFKVYSGNKMKYETYLNKKQQKVIKKRICFYDLIIEGNETKIRKFLKGEFLAMLNAPDESSRFKSMKTVFANKFPCINMILRGIKQLDENFQHKIFSHLVLQIESIVVLAIVAKEFKTKFPDCILITLHDCIITTKEYINELHYFMQAKISDVLNLNIKVKSERVTICSAS